MDSQEFEDMEDINDDNNETKIVFKTNIMRSETQISEEDLHSLYHSFDIDFNEINRKYSLWRFEVIHIRGVQDMSSEDVLKYFEDFEPNSIEWVNDLSCNVVFSDHKSAAIALKALTTALVVKMSKYIVDSSLGIEVIDADSLPVPIPPQFRWRLGKSVNKSKALLLRFATNKDKKMSGARPLSQYYAKYGVPENISEEIPNSERKRRYNSNELTDNRTDTIIDWKTKRFRMRADDEELKSIQSRLIPKVKAKEEYVERPRKSIWDRLDNNSSGNNLASAADTDVLQIAFDNKTNRRKIWRQSPLSSSVSMSQSYKNVFDKKDLRTKLRKNSF